MPQHVLVLPCHCARELGGEMVAQLRGGYTHGRPLLLAGQHALKTELQRVLRLVKQLSLTHTVASPTHAMASTNTPLDAIHIGRYQVLPRTDRIQDVDTRTVHPIQVYDPVPIYGPQYLNSRPPQRLIVHPGSFRKSSGPALGSSMVICTVSVSGS